MPPKASHQWNTDQRHVLHILATHYKDSSWVDRGAIFNDVFGVNLAYTKVRDEYGGHKNGMRNAPTGIAPTRSVSWNDEVCRDEFGLPGPYNQQQAQLRQQLLQRIQRSIRNLRLDRNNGLMAINMVVGSTRADNNSSAPAAPVANPAPVTASNTTALAGASASSSSAAAATTSTDPAQGGRLWYHTQEIVKEGGEFVYRPKDGLSYSVTPSNTYRRTVKFSSTLTKTIAVCDMAVCMECRRGRAVRDE